MVDSYEIDFMKGNVILVKVDEMKMELDDQGFCSSLPLNVDTFTTPLRGSLHLVRDTSAEKEFDIAM